MSSTRSKVQKVQATFKMDTATFEQHMTRRHGDSLGELRHLHGMSFEQEQTWRSFHRRLHYTRQDRLDHEHGHDPVRESVRRAIELLQDGHKHGWYELAGVRGFVSVFPSGEVATRVDGVIVHHATVAEAADLLTQVAT